MNIWICNANQTSAVNLLDVMMQVQTQWILKTSVLMNDRPSVDSFHSGAFTRGRGSPRCIWLCRCRRCHSSLTHRTPAACSTRWHFLFAQTSRWILARSCLDAPRCALHEAWSRVQERTRSSTCWCLRNNKKRFLVHRRRYPSSLRDRLTHVKDVHVQQGSDCATATTD